MTAAEVAIWNRTIFPDGRGLPAGHGTAQEGRTIYAERCAMCHGEHGEGATAEELVGEPQPPTPENPSKAIGSYWPFATTVFDFVRRSMPPAAPGSLSDDQVYAVTAYLLAVNKIIGEADELNAQTLPKVKMPNRDGFIWIDVQH
jgi:cytochrome c